MARIYEKDIPDVIEALQQLLNAGTATVPATGLSPEEVELLRNHRRQKQLVALKNKGIDIAPTTEPT
jgi:hypothetical protein